MEDHAVPIAIALFLIGLGAVLWEVGAIIAFWATVALVIFVPVWVVWATFKG